MSGLTLAATAVVVACDGASVIVTSPIRSGGVTVLARVTAGGFTATAGLGTSAVVVPARVSFRGAVTNVPVEEGGAESTMWVSAPSRGLVPERGD